MGSSSYSYAVDMWAAGCVFAELLLRKPWFPGNCDMDQLDRIFKVGLPSTCQSRHMFEIHLSKRCWLEASH
jgi:serine/threonine protein kinase